MKRFIFVFLVLSLLTFSFSSFADTASKFKGGFKEVILSPLKVSDNVKAETANAKFLPFALAGGFLKGSFYMAKQIVTGTLDVVTSPLDMIHK
jgi:hypothetical protein